MKDKNQTNNCRKMLFKCQCCGKDVGFMMNCLRGMGDTKTSRACDDCKDEYFEQVKSRYFVEEYKGNDIYKWNDFYFPYWDAPYAYNTLEDCRNRIGNPTAVVVDMNTFHIVSAALK